jgi:ceramide glucosyltransferase
VARTTLADEILVFVDADACPTRAWLSDLVRPMVEEEAGAIGATTGFRYYVPANGRLPNVMASIINAAVAALLGPGWRNIAWGGSMALRRADFFGFGVDEAWQRALSDDYVLSWCVKNQAKKKIQFVQGCLVGSAAEFTWGSFWEFAGRQYRITKVCAPGVWLAAAGAAMLYLIGLLYTFVFFFLSVTGVVPHQGGGVDLPLGVMFVALYAANVIRGWFLLEGGREALPEQSARLRAARLWFTLGYPASLLVNLLALGRSAWGRTIEWRGVGYTMHNRLETSVERRKA